jgi:hypothetical protein
MGEVKPLSADEITQLEAQHDRIARMVAELDVAQVDATARFAQAIVNYQACQAETAIARAELRTIKERRMGLLALLRRYD